MPSTLFPAREYKKIWNEWAPIQWIAVKKCPQLVRTGFNLEKNQHIAYEAFKEKIKHKKYFDTDIEKSYT